MARKRTKVWRHTAEQRQTIIDTARREKLSAEQVEKRFGISRWTYYGWRSKARGIHAGVSQNGRKLQSQPRWTRRAAARASVLALAGPIEATLRAQIRRLLGPILQEELDAYLRGELGHTRGRGRPTNARIAERSY